MRSQPLICVRDVEASRRWDQRLLGCQSYHCGPNNWEVWLRDPHGYTVVLASPDGSADGDWAGPCKRLIDIRYRLFERLTDNIQNICRAIALADDSEDSRP